MPAAQEAAAARQSERDRPRVEGGRDGASEDPTAAEISEAVAMAGDFDRVIVATYSAGPLPQGQADLVTALVAIGKPVVAASIGTPYDIASHPSVRAYVASYALNFLPTYILAPAALRATVDVIFGAQPDGRLPVPIPNSYPFGARPSLPGLRGIGRK